MSNVSLAFLLTHKPQNIRNSATWSYRFTDIVSSKTKNKKKEKMLQKKRNNIESANIFYYLSEYRIIKHIIVLGRNNQTIKRHFTNELSVSVTVSFLIA